jgi:hypothetical protein
MSSTARSDDGAAAGPPFVFILSWERPIYLWVSLDSLFRRTTPLVREVIEGFARRSMFHAVHLMESNEPDNLHKVLRSYLPEIGPYFAYVESDISIEAPLDTSWLETMGGLMDSDSRLAMLGSYCDARDFPDVEATRALFPDLSDADYRALVKATSPERSLPVVPPDQPVISPFNPPGRLVLFRTEAVAPIGLSSDLAMHRALLERGWTTGISTAVRHRHLSLLHVYDEPRYDTAARTTFFDRFGQARAGDGDRTAGDAPAAGPGNGDRINRGLSGRLRRRRR